MTLFIESFIDTFLWYHQIVHFEFARLILWLLWDLSVTQSRSSYAGWLKHFPAFKGLFLSGFAGLCALSCNTTITKSDDSHRNISKHETLTQCWFNAGPLSTTLCQHWNNNKTVIGTIPVSSRSESLFYRSIYENTIKTHPKCRKS